jgi:hypothetical protein
LFNQKGQLIDAGNLRNPLCLNRSFPVNPAYLEREKRVVAPQVTKKYPAPVAHEILIPIALTAAPQCPPMPIARGLQEHVIDFWIHIRSNITRIPREGIPPGKNPRSKKNKNISKNHLTKTKPKPLCASLFHGDSH